MPGRIIPPLLKPGDKIAIVATARKISREEVQPAAHIFESWGLEVVLSDELFAAENQFAGNDLIRARAFGQQLNDPAVKAIVCARGGYGTVRIIDSLDLSRLDSDPKWIVGFSDITVLHSHIHRHTSLVTLHAPMPVNMQPHTIDKSSIDALHDLLMHGKEWDTGIYPVHPLNRPGVMQGELVGGNLSVLYSLLGSSSDIDTNGKILFIEDLDEYLYHVDRMMQALKRSGKLAGLSGLIVGSMSDMKDNTVPFGQTAEEIIRAATEEYTYPLLFSYPAGHEKINKPLLLGSTRSITVA